MRWIVLFLFVACAVYVHRRGRVRHGVWRQLSDHSTFTAPLNCFCYLFSAVKNAPFLSAADFPELAPLRAHWQMLRQEALALYELQRIRPSDKYDDIGFNSFFRRGWKRFYLKWYDRPHPSAVVLCPRSVALLATIPSVKAAMFALLPAGATLGLHRDPLAVSLRYHLGLVTPNDARCAIVVDGVPYVWHDGEGVVFDETYLHEAANRTARDRIILFCDVERPLKYHWAQAVSRAAGGFLLRASAAPNETGDRTGGLNRAFRHLYVLRRFGKRLKAWNRTVYYVFKWSLFGALAWAVFGR